MFQIPVPGGDTAAKVNRPRDHSRLAQRNVTAQMLWRRRPPAKRASCLRRQEGGQEKRMRQFGKVEIPQGSPFIRRTQDGQLRPAGDGRTAVMHARTRRPQPPPPGLLSPWFPPDQFSPPPVPGGRPSRRGSQYNPAMMAESPPFRGADRGRHVFVGAARAMRNSRDKEWGHPDRRQFEDFGEEMSLGSGGSRPQIGQDRRPGGRWSPCDRIHAPSAPREMVRIEAAVAAEDLVARPWRSAPARNPCGVEVTGAAREGSHPDRRRPRSAADRAPRRSAAPHSRAPPPDCRILKARIWKEDQP